MPEKELINHPSHYGGPGNPLEVIKIIRHYNLGFNLGNTVKYILRAGKKDGNNYLQDLKKSLWYIKDEIEFIESQTPNQNPK